MGMHSKLRACTACRSCIYSTHGLELLQCEVVSCGEEPALRTCKTCHLPSAAASGQGHAWERTPQLRLFKLQGDPNVPAGQLSVVSSMGEWRRGAVPWHNLNIAPQFFGACLLGGLHPCVETKAIARRHCG